MSLKTILECYPDEEFLIADGFDDAVIGYDVNSMVLIYSIELCRQILIKQGMTDLEAEEYLWDNTITAYVGEKTPIWVDDET